MRPAVCGHGGNPDCWGGPVTAGGRKTARRKTARRKTARRKTRRGGARRSRRRGVRGGRQSNNMPPHIMGTFTQRMSMLRGGGMIEFHPAVCGSPGLNNC